MVERLRKRNKQQQRDWTNTGSFISKPAKGWLHPDDQLSPDAGVCYGVRYIGCMEVKESMKSLDFDTRTAVAKESISRVCDAAGLKTAGKKSKRANKIATLLGSEPQMVFAGSNVNLTITTENLTIMNIENGDIIGIHQMPCISFASGGDPDTLDFVAYVAKDENGRLCHVLECGGGLAQDVITTIGQAFELRFKQFLANKPQPIAVDRYTRMNSEGQCSDHWGEEEDLDYYNDRMGACPPDHELNAAAAASPASLYSSPRSNQTIGNVARGRPDRPSTNLIDFDTDLPNPRVYDNSHGALGLMDDLPPVYDNPAPVNSAGADPNQSPIHSNSSIYGNKKAALDAFDMKPFHQSLPSNQGAAAMATRERLPYSESWFHGKIGRDKCEDLLLQNGHFLVRESPNAAEQFVLSARSNGRIKHLLLVDPQGVVRTKDRTFDSVTELVMYHMDNQLPITSADSELFLLTPVLRLQ